MYRTGKNFDVKLRLNEINRRSVELSPTSPELANLPAHRDNLQLRRWPLTRPLSSGPHSCRRLRNVSKERMRRHFPPFRPTIVSHGPPMAAPPGSRRHPPPSHCD